VQKALWVLFLRKAALPPPVQKASEVCLAESGFAASRAESLWLSASSLIQMRLRLGGAAAKRIAVLTESQRLSARKAVKPEYHPKVYLDERGDQRFI